ncbi:MAG: nucleotidyltransferase family protein [Aquabacterium sp.]|uniref:nucleotidyltransferase family protein n=1 Tax=Aquabacterium sp. TaxID=1872578 RepID=UPI00120BFEAC|nr:nucleotidyltransferase family protein [Aquabacterium sp.]TAL00039.1 MAG: nucleotidyltransferase family protein [Aquabacterium sp.]
MSVAGLILAAGQGTRFGADKRLAVMPDGRTLLASSLQPYVGVCRPLLVVIRPDDMAAHDVAKACGAQIVVCTDADRGMGHSLAEGARALLEMPGVAGGGLKGVLIGLADMPRVSCTCLQALQQALLASDRPVAPVHQGTLGQPRALPARYLPALARLQGDQGARHLLDWQREALLLDVEDPGVLLDVDTPEDLRTLPVLAAHQAN